MLGSDQNRVMGVVSNTLLSLGLLVVLSASLLLAVGDSKNCMILSLSLMSNVRQPGSFVVKKQSKSREGRTQ